MRSLPIAGENVSTDIFSTMRAQRLQQSIQWAMAHEAFVSSMAVLS